MLRATRAAVFSALCVVLAISSHTAVSGDAVSWRLLLVVFLGVWVGVWSFTERERGPVAVIAATLGVQLLLHGAFSVGHALQAARLHAAHAGHPMSGAGMAAESGMGTGMAGSGMGTGMAGPSAAGAAAPGHGLVDGPASMVAGHLAVALLSAVWLWWGERALFGLLRWAAHRVLGPPPRPVNPPTPVDAEAARPTAERPPRLPGWARPIESRGPPARPAFPA
ncbi:hypothetical protein FH609_025755 [Streptomyces sp. 3MP-14]|uniref:Uncharacterized protein n=1 Tax=Streptomyces mimosae TaxID=2586635 RepID=A0A5N6A1N6_9ACTN|nr:MULTISPECIES: hypothetical protein [Streptomyces]KAB8162013.1 hypothetical protein FH607_023405 [Streptomyces mimosae]KAB8173711.1 hypothetical protein FH609_025755 [Streptomyces sp. 3MP-14]